MIGKVISFQVRDQEDEEQREVRLADKRRHQAVVRFVVVVVVVVVVDTLEMFLMVFCTCLAQTQLFCTNTCTYLVGARVPEICLLFIARTNYSQVRQQEDDAQREDRLAKDRDHHALVRFVVVIDTGAILSVCLFVRFILTSLKVESRK